MGKLVQAAKITHVPSIWMSHTMEKFKGIRDFAIDGYYSMREQAREANVDTYVILDTHWITNQGFHLNGKDRHQGSFISHELPHMLADLEYDHKGDQALGDLIVEEVAALGEKALAHKHPALGVEYATLVPMHFMNEGLDARVLPVATNQFSTIEENRAFGEAIRRAIEKSDSNVSLLASGSLSHDFAPNAISQDYLNKVHGAFNEQTDRHVIELWEQGRWSEFLEMLPSYAARCYGEVGMVDTAMLFGALGWDSYDGEMEIHTKYFGSSGTGQMNATFTV